MAQRCTIQAVIHPGDESGYVADSIDLAVVTQVSVAQGCAARLVCLSEGHIVDTGRRRDPRRARLGLDVGDLTDAGGAAAPHSAAPLPRPAESAPDRVWWQAGRLYLLAGHAIATSGGLDGDQQAQAGGGQAGGDAEGVPAPSAKPGAKSAAASPDFPVVGIGASAGGLAAIEEFLAAMPTDEPLGMALVLVQHLDPDHKSLLLDLVKRYTHIEVAWAEDGMEVRSGCAYVMPPNKDMALVGGRLVLVEPEAPRGRRLPIDYFFRSLAADQHERAVGIVLSGTGSDGTLGLRAIKGEGGMAMAQTPESAGYDGMPRSAIATGLVDYVLSPAEMPEPLLGYVSRAFGRAPRPVRADAPGGSDRLLEVLHQLRDRTGHDFTHYKTSTLRRRVERRMAVTRVESMDDYLVLLKRDSLEVETLFRELLIGVTNFFRDAPAFEALAAEVLPGLIAAHFPGDPVRVWVPGCSTGEEAYSIAMLLQELADGAKRNVPAQVFATDIDAEAIERARDGVYPDSISADVSPERLARFFVQDGDTYRVAKTVRDHLVFAKQDVTKDPPFSRVDLISCRNLLIYMDGDLQQKLMPLFHYALNPDGYLFLGTSETVGEAADLFAPVDKKWKLYQRRGTVTPRQRLATTMPLRERRRGPRPAPDAPRGAPARARARAGREDAARQARPRLRGRQRRGRRALHPRPHRPLPRACGRRAQRQPPQDGPRRPAARAHHRHAQGPGAEGGGALRAPARQDRRRHVSRQPDHRADVRAGRRQGRVAGPLRRRARGRRRR